MSSVDFNILAEYLPFNVKKFFFETVSKDWILETVSHPLKQDDNVFMYYGQSMDNDENANSFWQHAKVGVSSKELISYLHERSLKNKDWGFQFKSIPLDETFRMSYHPEYDIINFDLYFSKHKLFENQPVPNPSFYINYFANILNESGHHWYTISFDFSY